MNEKGKYNSNGVFPGSRAFAARWTTSSALYMYGGWGWGKHPNRVGLLADVWKWSLASSSWNLVFSNDAVNDTFSAGFPGARCRASAARFNGSENSFIFGGSITTSSGAYADISNDLWMFVASDETFVSLFGGCAAPVYGTQGVASASSCPGSYF